MTQPIRKAVSLLSGGLDSLLATKLILDQGIHVEAINFYTGFCHSGHTSGIRNNKKSKPKRNDALWSAEQLGIKLHIIDIVDDYKDIVINPKYGYGQNINPCLDCKIFMVKKAFEWMHENDFDFIFTGEVVGQRPKSQRKETMPIVSKRSGAEDRLLRPLCAKLFEPTLPEREGWIDRDKLLNLSGRSRKPQIAMAKDYNFEDFAQPSGGCCVLTDPSYSIKLQDMWQTRGEKNYDLDDIILLKVGRHLRPNPNYKLIIGREEGENNFMEGYRKQFPHMRIQSHVGPLSLIEGDIPDDDLEYAASICARFSAGRNDPTVTVTYHPVDGYVQEFVITPMPTDDINQAWYI